MEVAAAASYGLKAADDVDNLRATELRLGLPGTEEEEEEPQQKAALPLLPPAATPPPSTPRGKKRDVVGSGNEDAPKKRDSNADAAPPAAK